MKRPFNLSYSLPCLDTCSLDPVTTHSFSEQWWSQIIPYARSHHSHYNTNRWGQDSWLFRIDWRKGTELKVCLIMIEQNIQEKTYQGTELRAEATRRSGQRNRNETNEIKTSTYPAGRAEVKTESQMSKIVHCPSQHTLIARPTPKSNSPFQ